MKKFASLVLMASLGGMITLGGYKLFIEKEVTVVQKDYNLNLDTVNASFPMNRSSISHENTDFTIIAESTVNAVVHVKNTTIQSVQDPFSSFFYGRPSERKFSQVGMGSGVIISSDGYIITNNHVIDGATEIEITLNNKKTYKAELIGADKNTDIALVKIDATDLPYVIFGNSDNTKVGEWVLAVGNPYNLTSTVTAGIVSAKGRDLKGNSNTESFIQTDAAVNPGNSGGALVNTKGELIGINTAISSQTGSFIGYSFAVPSNIAKKIVEDFMEFGNVQKALLGIVPDMSKDEEIEGVQIASISEDSGAEKAGLKEGDIITDLDGVKISKFSDLKGHLRAKRPGEIVQVTVNRNDEKLVKNVTLFKDETLVLRSVGMVIKNINKKKAKKLNIESGVVIEELVNEYLMSYGITKGCVITKINNKPIKFVEDVELAVSEYINGGAFYMEILNLKGEIERFNFR